MIKIFDTESISVSEILKREQTSTGVEDIVADVIANVRKNGDTALKEYTKKFDKADLDSLEVTDEEIENAFAQVDDKFIEIIKKAKENIYNFHKHQVRNSFVISENDGIVLGQKVLPLRRVGLYVPGGTASYPSSVLMNCIPAKIAGVEEIVMTTPPRADGTINPVILAAAKIAGVGRIYKVGGSQAIAALGTCNPEYVAADLLSQAEHDKLASAVLVTDSKELANAVSEQLEVQLSVLPREEIARTSIDNNGKIIITENILKAVEIANMIAPEHLEICVDNPFDYLDKVKNAGSVFLGKNCPEALGDYFAGPNHTLPTSGTARFSSPLSVDDFVKKTAFTYYTLDALSKVSEDIAYFAEKEGLSGHARSAVVRTRKK